MKSIRILLKLLSAVTLTAIPVTTVVNCGDKEDEGKLLLNKVSINLGLTDASGKGLKAIMLNWDNDKPYFY